MAFRVLIVDDSSVMRAFIRRIIVLSGMEGAEFLEASDGREALNLLHNQWVDVVLTDINMPSMDGEQLVRCLAADDMLQSVPVVIVSTDAGAKSHDPPGRRPRASSIRPKACRSSSVETSPPPPEGNAGGFAHWPAGGS